MKLVSFKILGLHLFNFKGFVDETFFFGQEDVVILGGKNGFGKTTIFDAIQLVLTGHINRYRTYSEEYTDGRIHNSDLFDRPLCKGDIATVRIDLYVKIDDKNIILTRKANSNQLSIPIDFKAFDSLYYRYNETDDLTKVSDSDIEIVSCLKKFDFINYIEQEEALSFLKQDEKSRADNIKKLVDTSNFDEPISKIKKITEGLKIWQNEIEYKRKIINSKKELLDNQQLNEEIISNDYIQLFDDNSEIEFEWDKQNPILSFEKYSELLSENGILSNIDYYIHNRLDYQNYVLDNKRKEIMKYVEDLCFYIHWKEKEQWIENYDYFYKEVVPHNRRITLSNIDTFRLLYPKGIDYTEDIRKTIESKQKTIIQLAKSASKMEFAYNDILNKRQSLFESLHNHSTDTNIKTCPLCGYNYQTQENLLSVINNVSESQNIGLQEIKGTASKELEEFNQMIDSLVYSYAKNKFDEYDLSYTICKRYFNLDKSKMSNYFKCLHNWYAYDVSSSSDIDVEIKRLTTYFEAVDYKFNMNLDYELLQRTFNSYVKFISKEKFTLETLKKKRSYLISQWNKKVSEEKAKNENDIRSLNVEREKFNIFQNNIKKLEKELTKRKNEYVQRIFSDIEILFYIYSGRILQDNKFGRGLFVKFISNNCVRFVDNWNSTVDVLYKLSSGQLIALIIAFTLSINKLYSKAKFIAIDDPIQTIDDINIWGLIETMRHEFKDRFMLLSTHEINYGSLIRYKFSNVGIAAKYFDMLELVNKQHNKIEK